MLIRVLFLAFLFEIALHMARPMVPLRLAEIGASPFQIGLTLTVSGLVPLLVGLPLGRLSDRIGPRTVMVIGMALSAVGFLTLAQAESMILIAVGKGISVGGSTAAVIAAQVMVSQMGGPQDREQNFGWFGTAVAMSQLAGPPLGGYVAEAFSLPTAFVLSAAVCGAPILLWRLLPDPELEAGAGESVEPKAQSGLSLMRMPDVRYGIIVAFLIVFAFDIRASFFPVFLEQESGLSRTQIGLVFTLQGLAAISVRPFMGWLSRTLGSWTLLTLSLVISLPSFALIPFTRGPIWAAVAMAGLGLGTGLSQPLTMSIIAGGSPYHARGLALGLRQTSQRLGNALSPLVMGALASLAGLGAPFLAAAVIMAISVGVSLSGGRAAAAGGEGRVAGD